jgi:hypothetical protein
MGLKSFIIGIVFGFLFFYLFLPQNKIYLQDLGLGEGTKKVFGKVNDYAIHCSDLTDFDLCLKAYETNGKNHPVILWLGNSQLHGINNYTSGEQPASSDLYNLFQNKEQYFLTLSQPNANLQEHYLFFAYLLNKLHIKNLILPLVFDDMREDNIRHELLELLNDENTILILNNTNIGKNLLQSSNNKKQLINIEFRENFENELNTKLGFFLPAWEKREEMRGKFLFSLYMLRNSVFKIDASSIRKKIIGPYEKNKNAYLAMLHLAKLNKISVLVYIAPIRNDVKIPYNIDEYSSFKSEMKLIADNHNAKFINLEDLISGKLWNDAELTGPDFMHFKIGGHKKLAQELYKEILSIKN